jgi:hypothetical protein
MRSARLLVGMTWVVTWHRQHGTLLACLSHRCGKVGVLMLPAANSFWLRRVQLKCVVAAVSVCLVLQNLKSDALESFLLQRHLGRAISGSKTCCL